MKIHILRIILLILVPVILLMLLSGWLMEWLWLRELGYNEIFKVLKGTQALMFLGAFMISGLYLLFNFRFMGRVITDSRLMTIIAGSLNITIPMESQHKWMRRFFSFAALVIAFIFALAIMLRWDDALRFLYMQPFGAVDPIFGKDVSFYMFQLPLIGLLQSSLTALAFFTVFLLGVIYFVTDMISFRPGTGFRAHPSAWMHLKGNIAFWLLTLSASFYLSRYELLYRADGVVFGPGYTDVAIEMPALWIASVLTALLAALIIISRWINLPKITVSMAILVAIVLVLGRGIFPALVQQFRVNPNELAIEQPFIENNIKMTRLAYGIDDVLEIDYPADDTLKAEDIRNNQEVIENVRLWDHRLLIQTYRQLQEIRPYYQFNTIGIDRYRIDGDKQQVMLAARELSPRLPDGSNSWVNRHLQYTHGFGVAMSPVNAANRQGEPLMLARDLPPVTHPDIPIENAAIYYGKRSQSYFIVNSTTEELHYPAADGNVYHHYTGRGGIPFRNFFYRLLFAWELNDINILLSDYITSESRLQIWRGVQERIERITPFLQLDEDPYLVVYNGRLVWIQDAYTTSSRFPYSTRLRNFNYIRNPVKIVVDAYDGSVDYYVIDDSDPVMAIYQKIFPDLFHSADKIPEGLAEHFRYPVNLFEAQLEIYSRYHMTHPRVFYNDEDRWRRPFEQYGGRRIQMEPYYVLGRLPGKETEEIEFKLISPFTPEGRNNMIAWMAARSDPEYYGQLVTYRLPKDRLIYGPTQIESRIDQDPEISRQLALWDQRGSRVIRGNLLVVPIENSFIYVEPVFLLADRDDIPQLQRVIVSVGDDISMQPTIQAAMIDLFGEEADFPEEVYAPVAVPDEADLLEEADEPLPVSDRPVRAPAPTLTDRELQEIRELWQELRQAINEGNWLRYGELLQELDERLDQ